jgi:hypothetical protein
LLIFSVQADADDLDAAKAILAGMKDRFERTGKPGSLIHTVRITLLNHSIYLIKYWRRISREQASSKNLLNASLRLKRSDRRAYR